MKVVKNSGDIVNFDLNKLKISLLKSGANESIINDILNKIEHEIYNGISTKKIYKMAFGLLKKSSNSIAARYNLRAALKLLGPAGFFFEKYISQLFISDGYIATTNLTLNGKCVSHEIDVIVKRNEIIEMIECKFHEHRDIISDVKVPMYILSRFNDLKDKRHQIFSNKDEISKCWIITNNRFTTDAIQFGICSGLNLLSWDFPKNNNIRTKIDTSNLYPITCLTTLSVMEKNKLLILDVIMVKEIINNSDPLEKIGLSSNRIKNVLKEASELSRIL